MKKIYSSYNQVPEEYKWDLESILKNTTFEELKNQYFDIFNHIIATKESKYDSKENYLDYLKVQEKFLELEFKINNYLQNKSSINVVDPEINKEIADFDNKVANYLNKLGSEISRIKKYKDKLLLWKDTKEFSHVKNSIESSIESLKHTLSDDVENYLQQSSKGDTNLEAVFDILDNSEVDFGYATSSKNKKFKITNGSRINLLKNNDELIRKTTHKNYLKGYYKHRQSFAQLLIQHFKQISVEAKIRNYDSAVDSLISSDYVQKQLLDVIYKNVKDNMFVFKQFYKYQKKFFKNKFNKKMQPWDYQLDLIKTKTNYTIEDAKNIFKEIISVMPNRYKEVAINALDSGWIDFESVKNKEGGAYSIGQSYGIDKKYILMNFDNSLSSVNTLCHEMGHSMHSYFSDKNQHIFNSQYPIFLAEIASIFNELLLTDYLIENAKNDEQRFNYINESIRDFIGTVIQQTIWSNYEFNLYNAMDNDEPYASYEQLEQLYVDTRNEYFKDIHKAKISNHENIYSVIVPHYYYEFYVYKYALGYIVANSFYKKYKAEGKQVLDDYIDKFLSTGSSQKPADILKNAGIDIYDENMYKMAFENIHEKIKTYIKLGKKIFNK
ncbi:oligoendopeptidase F [Mycoplasma zalophi]|uniref:oligoendopeptidase F n=1 Tax=Mycoplasma zalophi TaxID=191287 RepID=UPI001C1185C2|nr:oligoendopeptidase F [Mycoplasma zalophi]MBU4691043.1 oligoendopeptidase F [Mycoplasma zalophi]